MLKVVFSFLSFIMLLEPSFAEALVITQTHSILEASYWDKDTIISFVKVLSGISISIGILFSIKSFRELMYKLFLKFEFYITAFIRFIQNLAITQYIKQGFFYLANIVIKIIRKIRTLPNLIKNILGIVTLSFFVIRPEFIDKVAIQYVNRDVIEFFTCVIFVGLGVFMMNILYQYTEKKSKTFDNNKQKDIDNFKFSRLFLLTAIPFSALAFYAVSRYTQGYTVALYTLATLTYICLIFLIDFEVEGYVKDNSEYSVKFSSAHIGLIFMILSVIFITQPFFSFNLNDKQQTTLAVMGQLFYSAIFLTTFVAIGSSMQVKKDSSYYRRVVPVIFSAMILVASNYSSVSIIYKVVFNLIWGTTISLYLIKNLNFFAKIFNGKLSPALFVLFAILSIQHPIIDELKFGYATGTVWSFFLIFIASIYAGNMLIKSGNITDSKLIFITSILSFSFLYNFYATSLFVYLLFGAITTIAMLIFILRLMNFRINDSLEIITTVSLIAIFIADTQGLVTPGLKYLPVIAFICFWLTPKNFIKLFGLYFQQNIPFGLMFLTIAPVVTWQLGIIKPDNAIALLSHISLTVIVFIYIFINLFKIHKALGFFSAGAILYFLAQIFEKTYMENYWNLLKTTVI